MDAARWTEWLAGWNRELLAAHVPGVRDAFLDPAVTPAVLASGWLGAPGATDDALRALEARLGVALPPSYRAFLQASDGFLQPGMIVPRLLRAGEVQWYRAAHEDLIDAWGSGAGDDDPVAPALAASLQVSAEERVGTAVYLLDPRAVGPDGEWEALLFAHWVPGVERHASFAALMASERAARAAPPPPPPPSGWRAALDVLRWIFRPERAQGIDDRRA